MKQNDIIYYYTDIINNIHITDNEERIYLNKLLIN